MQRLVGRRFPDCRSFSPFQSNRSRGLESTESINHSHEVLNGESSVFAALETTNVALLRAQRERDLLLSEAVGTAQNAQLLAKCCYGFSPRLMTALNVVDRFPLGFWIDLEDVTPLEQLENFFVRFPLGCRPWILAISSYGHRQLIVCASVCGQERTP